MNIRLIRKIWACMCIILCFGCVQKTEFEILQEKVDESSALLGVSYLGHLKGEESFRSFIDSWYERTNLDIFKEYDLSQILIQEGNEVYCMIPSNQIASVKIYKFDLNFHDATDSERELLYESNGQEVIYLIGNISDIVPSFYILIEDQDRHSFYYSPNLSLKDGSLNLLDDVVIDVKSWLDY